MTRDFELNDLGSRVSDGERIDWDEAERSASSEDDRRVLRNLRLLEDIVSAHRSLHGDGGTVSRAPRQDPGPAYPPIPPGQSWGNLEIRRQVGEGGFGDVYLAWDPQLEREVALKLLKREPSSRRTLASAVIREGRLLARVNHPNVVTVHGAETHDGRVGLWMEYVDGRSLEGLLREQGKLGAREATLIGVDLCRALVAVHRAGLVHRDVKAKNVMRERGGRIILMDFGAGRDSGDVEKDSSDVSGTPLYIAPEIYGGEPATVRSDIYSLGVLLFHLVTDGYPVHATSLCEIREMHERGEQKLLRDLRSDLPESFIKVVERALSREPEARFATAGEMEQALSLSLGVEAPPAIQTPAPPARRPGWLAGAAAIAVFGLVAVAMVMGLGPFGTSSGPGDDARPAVEQQAEAPDDATGTTPSAVSPEPPPVARADGADRHEPVLRGPAGTPGPVSPALEPYIVEASVIRMDKQGRRERLDQGAQLAIGDWVSLEFEASRDVYLYVLNEDEQGHTFYLFPLPDSDLQNPLPGGQAHEVPGRLDGQAISWEVNTPGGREHLLLLASPERLVEFEVQMAALARPRTGQTAVPIPEEVRDSFRGIGGLSPQPDRSAPDGSIDRLFETAQWLASGSEVARGAWLRRIELENPRR